MNSFFKQKNKYKVENQGILNNKTNEDSPSNQNEEIQNIDSNELMQLNDQPNSKENSVNHFKNLKKSNESIEEKQINSHLNDSAIDSHGMNERNEVVVNTSMWVEKYRPTNLNELIGQDIIIKTLKTILKQRDSMPHLLFYGPPGTGKTVCISTCHMNLSITDNF